MAWADKVALNPAGTQIAISSMLDDTAKVNQGVVYVYTQHAGVFEFNTNTNSSK